jgi:integrase
MANVVRLAPTEPEARPTARSSIAKAAASRDKPPRPYEVRAKNPVGLLLRVQPSGKRTFYVQVGRGRRIRIGPAPTWTMGMAEARAKAILLDPGAYEKKAGHTFTLREYIETHYIDHAEAKLKNGAKSVARVKSIWKPLLTKRMADITATDVDRLRNKRVIAGVAPATVNRDVAALSGIFTHWVEHGGGKSHPLAGMEPLDVADDETIRYLTHHESKRLRAALAARDARMIAARASANEWRAARGYETMPERERYADHLTPMVLLSMNTGLRQGELFSLEWNQIDLRLKTLVVLASHAKGNATRTVPLNAEALAVLVAIEPEPAKGLVFKSPVSGGRFNNVKKAWAELTKAAKLDGLRWHDLRHDFASQLVMRGVPLYTVQKLLGHANARMTQRYAKLAPGALADAVNLLGAP